MRYLLALLIIPAIAQAEEATYCTNPAVVLDWERQVAEAPADPAVQTLHALWLGLCAKIRDGSIERDMVAKIFESERARNVLERAKEEAEYGEVKGI